MESRRFLIVASVAIVAAGFGAASVGPASAAFDALMSCSKSTPCLEWDNKQNGDAVKGVSINGDALHGQTKFKSAGKNVGKSGVLGEDLSTSGNLNAGVAGVSKGGAGVIGTSSTWNGVEGLTTGSGTSGVYGQNSAPNGFGVAGRNTSSTFDPGGAAMLADGSQMNDGMHAVTVNGTAIVATSQNGAGMIVTGGCPQCGPNQGDRAALQIFSDASHANVIETCDYQQTPCIQNSSGFFVTNDGSGEFARELFVIGHLYADNGCTGCSITQTRTAAGSAVTSFEPRDPVPTIETFGEGRLVGGQARIAIDAAFANTMDKAQSYLVFLTPKSDSRGLYVTQETAAGFVVRENGNGTSSIGFDYRIVAKPLDAGRPAPTMRYTRGAAPR